MQEYLIRSIRGDDNVVVAKIIREVLTEMEVPKVASAFEDASLDAMFEYYQANRSGYYVLELAGKIVAAGGFAPLAGAVESICELQKVYFLPEVRGLGLGEKMVRHCLQAAQQHGYLECYLETMPNMIAAQALYQKLGFKSIDKSMGCTGHTSCSVRMLLRFSEREISEI